MLQWNLDIMNLYITKSSVIVKYMKNNLVIANKFCQSLHPLLYRVSTVLSLSWWWWWWWFIIILIFSIVSYAPTVVSHILKWMTKKDIISHRKGNIVTFDTNMFHFNWSKLQNTLCTLSVVFCGCKSCTLFCLVITQERYYLAPYPKPNEPPKSWTKDLTHI